MRESLIQFLACPKTGSALRLETEVIEESEILKGRLISEEGEIFPIEGGICRFVPDYASDAERSTVEAFGNEWQSFDDHGEHMAGTEMFLQFVEPLRPDDFRGKRILEVGCGGGGWLEVCARMGASEVVGLDYSEAVNVARRRNLKSSNVHVLQGSIFDLPLRPIFDIVVCVGVIHHLRDPAAGMRALMRVAKPGGRIAIWTYAKEGNELYLRIFLPIRKLTSRLPHRFLYPLSLPLAAIVYLHCKIARPMLRALKVLEPMASYFDMISRLSFRDIWSVVYDQLAPQIAIYPTRKEVLEWVRESGGELIEIGMRTGNSWRIHIARPSSS